jgi:uncharacterized DUF497 family protein
MAWSLRSRFPRRGCVRAIHDSPGDGPPQVKPFCLGRTEPSIFSTERGPQSPLTRGTFVHTLANVDIDWDPGKAEANLREHGVAFPEAATVLVDDYALTREDPDSIGEQRLVSLGMSATGALLVVVYAHREPVTYRLVSSWKANKPQRK